MQSKRILIFVIAISAMALVFLLIALRMLGDGGNDRSVQLVSAAQDIPSGVPLVAEQLKLVKLPPESVPSGISVRVQDLVGRIPRTTIKANQIVLESMLYSPNSSGGLAFSISPGKRAISLTVNEVSGVAGFVLPGSYVDFLSGSRDQAGRSQSRIILQNILVLAVGQDRVLGGDGKPKLVPSVTVEVTPQEAEVLDTARQTGNINLMLRNQTELPRPVEKAPAPAAPAAAGHHESGVEVIRGTTVRIEPGSGRSYE
jgi:pilus assembly protein CpaB